MKFQLTENLSSVSFDCNYNFEMFNYLILTEMQLNKLKKQIHSSAASYDLIRNISLKALFIAKCNDLICDCDLLIGQASRP